MKKYSLGETVQVARRAAQRMNRRYYVYATAYGFTATMMAPPVTQGYIVVEPDGTTREVNLGLGEVQHA